MSDLGYKSDFPPVITYKNRELEKVFFIKDKRKQLSEIRRIEQDVLDKDFKEITPAYRNVVGVPESHNLGFESGDLFNATKRKLLVDVYIMNIVEEAEEKNEEERINFLIDNRYKIHEGLFDSKLENQAYRDEVNQYIQDKLRDELHSIDSEVDLKDPISKFKPLKWNANKSSLGTLFGLLLKNGVITSSKKNIERWLYSSFEDQSLSSLDGSVGLKFNESEGKTKYSVQVEETSLELLNLLKDQCK